LQVQQELEDLQSSYKEREASRLAAEQALITAQERIAEVQAQLEAAKSELESLEIAKVHVTGALYEHCVLLIRITGPGARCIRAGHYSRNPLYPAAKSPYLLKLSAQRNREKLLFTIHLSFRNISILQAEVDEKAEARPCEGCRELSIAYTQASEDLLLAQRQARDAATQAEMLASDNASLEAKVRFIYFY
jgi:hypothetical protein